MKSSDFHHDAMDSLDEQLAQLKLLNSRPLSPRISKGTNGSAPGGRHGGGSGSSIGSGGLSPKKVGPAVPPKPYKKFNNYPEVLQSSVVKQSCEPLYSKRLQSDSVTGGVGTHGSSSTSSASISPIVSAPGRSILHRKQPSYGAQHHVYSNIKMTLDNPAILDQQLEALEHHKKQLEKKGLLPNPTVPKLSSSSFMNGGNTTESARVSPHNFSGPSPHHVYSNILSPAHSAMAKSENMSEPDIVYSNIMHPNNQNSVPIDMAYSNVRYNNSDELPPPPPLDITSSAINFNGTSNHEYLTQTSEEDELPPPPSPVSSSYSELRRATDNYPKMPKYPMPQYGTIIDSNSIASGNAGVSSAGRGNVSSQLASDALSSASDQQTYINSSYHNDYSTYGGPSSQSFSQSSSDYYGYGSISQGSSTYESIYEPINPRPPSQMSSRSNYSLYTSYVNGPQSSSGSQTPIGLPLSGQNSNENGTHSSHKEAEVEALTDLLVHSMDSGVDGDSYGICVKCGDRVVGENSGCTAMDQIYHITCFTCSQCQINLQGKPFYSLEAKPYCEEDYLNTLEKCSVCMKPILERILRATGKPYHPQCFQCVVCGRSLDGIPFTVDATNQNYCIEDFHKKFAPRCCVCRQPIMPEPGQEETVRVVALDRSFHFECYKCEDCGLLLSSEAEGRGCYPLDDHVLCKSCNAQRVQVLTNRMTTEL